MQTAPRRGPEPKRGPDNPLVTYDQGMEHGPSDFTDANVNPASIIEIARKGKFTGIVFQKGIAEKYREEIKQSKVPLIVKLNGKTRLREGEPLSRQLCTVAEALELGAKAVGYTIYLGSEYESEMFSEYEQIKREADTAKIPTIIWMYPRGRSLKGKKKTELMAYATRVALELGADIVKIQYEGTKKDLAWAVQAAGKTKVVIAGGSKTTEKSLLREVQDVMAVGGIGLAIGRNVWQAEEPLQITKKIKDIVWKK